MRVMDIGVGLPVVFIDHSGQETAALVQRVHNRDVLDLVVFPVNGSLQHHGSVGHENTGSTPFWRYCMEREEREANARAEAQQIEQARRQQQLDEERSPERLVGNAADTVITDEVESLDTADEVASREKAVLARPRDTEDPNKNDGPTNTDPALPIG